ncbi:MAG: trypsin-like peptidase domain-containing protein [Candidatus Moranbacteria bacterium]|nr:trypsin-like peptidase domain-containing protein [Candidatus Moranbacteria bacterium]
METNNIQEKEYIYSSKKYGTVTVIALVMMFSSLFGAVFGFLASNFSDDLMEKMGIKKDETQQEKQLESKETILSNQGAVIDVVEKSSPAVISIVVTKDVLKYRNYYDSYDWFFSPFHQERQLNGEAETERQEIGGGTGFFVSSDGMIVTNKHVVSDVQADYTVITDDGSEYSAQVLARHPVLDIALIKIEGENFPVVELGDSDNLKVGQAAVAIGNSMGEFANSVSLGIVSGLGRDIVASSGFGQSERLNNIIQTDAAINPGNSGGPLLDLSGRVIGVNVAIANGAQSIGFALPVNRIKNIIDEVKSTGKITIPYIGVRYVPLDKEIQKANNFPYDYGIIVLRGEKMTDFAVIPGSPADKAGIVENDIILEVDGKRIDSTNELPEIMSNYSIGDEATLKVWHKGEEKEVKVKFEERTDS